MKLPADALRADAKQADDDNNFAHSLSKLLPHAVQLGESTNTTTNVQRHLLPPPPSSQPQTNTKPLTKKALALHSMERWKQHIPTPFPLLVSSDEIRAIEFVKRSSALYEKHVAMCGDAGGRFPADFNTKVLHFLRESPPPKTRRITPSYDLKYATDVLKIWYFAHMDHPYPSKKSSADLARETGMPQAQIQEWFSNIRKRYWLRAQQHKRKTSSQAVHQPRAKRAKTATEVKQENGDKFDELVEEFRLTQEQLLDLF